MPFRRKLRITDIPRLNGTFVRLDTYFMLKSSIYRFKLHLRPKTLSGAQISDHDIPALPREKRPVDILVDFLKYLFACTRGFIVEGMFNGEQYWASLKGNIDFVLTHPNGWEGYQQNLMHQAAVIAGLVREGDADGRIQFVTEGEASLHFCIMNGALSSMHSVSIALC